MYTRKRKTVELPVAYRLHFKWDKFKFLFDEFAVFVGKTVTLSGKLLTVGDVNINWYKSNDPKTLKLNKILKNSELDQFVQKPTYTNRNILDLLFGSVADLTSGHAIVNTGLNINKPGFPKEKVKKAGYTS